MLDDMLALANCLLAALSRPDRHVLAFLVCAGLIAPCCAMFAVDARRQYACTYKKGQRPKTGIPCPFGAKNRYIP